MKTLSQSFFAVLLACCGGAFITASAADEMPAQPEAGPPAAVTVLYGTESILGRRVVSASGENAGWIVDVVADRNGRVQAVIVDYGGFLGIGSRKVAVSWPDLRFGSSSDPNAVAVDLPAERLARAPLVRAGQPVIAISSRRPAWHRAARK